ncbi:lysophospholipid acyltransferase family protein [Sulfurospirillum sp. 1612]|uniref:lysophospholipid acyltransferase family protein n=1 Tax=Sulfurospirillum sp. 1612 TaxID=3094835 RepID=UPI002F923FF3
MIDVAHEIMKKFPKLETRPSIIKKPLIKIAQKIVHEDKINDFLNDYKHLKGFEFVEAVLEYFKFDFSYAHNDLENIPSVGRVVIIANHPLGGLDALCLLKLLGKIRKDVKIIANDFLAGVDSLDSVFIKIDNFKRKQPKAIVKKIYEALHHEEAIIIFPAGEVSRISPYGIRDGKWQKGFLKFASRTNSPIVPILIDAKNSKTFYTLSLLNKTFSTLLLSDEMFKQHHKNINIKIGKIIPHEHIIPMGMAERYLPNLYKKHLYGLKKEKRLLFQTHNAIAHGERKEDLKHELKEAHILGQTADGKMIYLYDYRADSAIIKEIGRLREISFRKVNEGVNKKRDVDIYDTHYKHIILWDEEALEIIGAYRIAIGAEILEQYGVEGFYTHTLFNFNDSFLPYLKDAIELGRSFVQPKYWGSRALDYLWYGIGAYLKNNPQIKYMYGPVSLSASLPLVAKELIISFYRHYFGTHSHFVTPTNPYKPTIENKELIDIFTKNNYQEDLKILRQTLRNMNIAIPVLYKQYSELCEDGGVCFHDFNIDPNFSNCVDGFIMVEISKIKESKKKYLS